MDYKEQIAHLIPKLTELFPMIEVLYLFGSCTAKTNKTDSDIDLAVFINNQHYPHDPLIDLKMGAFFDEHLLDIDSQAVGQQLPHAEVIGYSPCKDHTFQVVAHPAEHAHRPADYGSVQSKGDFPGILAFGDQGSDLGFGKL